MKKYKFFYKNDDQEILFVATDTLSEVPRVGWHVRWMGQDFEVAAIYLNYDESSVDIALI